ncbi:protein TraC [Neisseria gonorrhoeae]|uniref:Protein TraC n=1 Tax=Neisseria gonorrhoeae TaxID=485 RepID=A0A378VX08_NEIGO|nr:protein TraC [Neisseria gonorrhoeae]
MNVEFKNDLVVLELEELKTKPDLQQIIMQLIMYRIMQGMYLSRSQYKIMMIDEAWALLGDTGTAARLLRKATAVSVSTKVHAAL